MANSGNQKLKILKIHDMLLRETDENHTLSTRQIIDRLEADGIKAERKSIYSDMDILRDYGMDIMISEERQGGYYLASKDFELPELKLLVDAVSASKFITEKKSRELVKKLETLSSRYEGTQLQRQVVVADRTKSENESIYYIIDVIYNCIDNNHKMRFQYTDWTPDKKKALRKDGAYYEISPSFLLWDNEYYYLVAYDSIQKQIRHYRVDKMVNATETENARDGIHERNAIHIADYTKKTFSMYAGKESTVTLRIDNSLIGVIIDRFGTDLSIRKEKDSTSIVRVNVEVSPQFYGWVTGLGNKIEIIGTDEVREGYQQYLSNILTSYQSN